MKKRHCLQSYPAIKFTLDDGREYELDFRLLMESEVSLAFEVGFSAGLLDQQEYYNYNNTDVREGWAIGEKIRLKQTTDLPVWLKSVK